ncbi:hypothetical protein SLEP1_g29854 [Rubroshorea leprosula]|uniref:FLZ-type domain-containing protein n=1 Tax=Rubroshorea leprosula TaxID=152421 RepID=A0AAV5K787_9ROSI|nr:hypothetical protein SLEP1_g29854 [Rubroshorea leprosula]
MAENGANLPFPADKNKRPTSFPRLLTGFATLKVFTDANEAVMSPTSILDSKSFSAFRNPFWSDSGTPKTPEPETRHKLGSKGIGLGIVDALRDDDSDPNQSKPETRMILFGSQLRIHIPPLPPSVLSPAESPKSTPEFGIKTRNSQLGLLSSSPARKSGFGSANSNMDAASSPRVFTGSLSATEMELSEDYTCVISHGANPRTTHIFDDCVVESCYGVVGFSALRKENGFPCERSNYQSENFLSSCYTCKKNLGQGKDIFIYRGEKAFCSRECRYQEMILEDEMDNLDCS